MRLHTTASWSSPASAAAPRRTRLSRWREIGPQIASHQLHMGMHRSNQVPTSMSLPLQQEAPGVKANAAAVLVMHTWPRLTQPDCITGTGLLLRSACLKQLRLMQCQACTCWHHWQRGSYSPPHGWRQPADEDCGAAAPSCGPHTWPAAVDPSASEQMVWVPASLLRRYEQLEWDNWLRHHRQWEWDMHAYYSLYHAGGKEQC